MTRYRQIGRYDYEAGKPIWATYKQTIERGNPARIGSPLGTCKCGGELLVLERDQGFLVCSCDKCAQMQYWEKTSARAAQPETANQ